MALLRHKLMFPSNAQSRLSAADYQLFLSILNVQSRLSAADSQLFLSILNAQSRLHTAHYLPWLLCRYCTARASAPRITHVATASLILPHGCARLISRSAGRL